MTRPEKIEEKVARAIPQPPEDFSDEQIAKAVLDALSVEDLLGLLEEKQGPTPDLIVARNALEAIKAEWAKNRSKDQPHDALNRVCGIANDALLKLDTAAELRGSYAMQAVARAALAAHSGSTGAAERVAEALRRLIEWFEQPRASSSGNTLSQIVVEARAALAAHQGEAYASDDDRRCQFRAFGYAQCVKPYGHPGKHESNLLDAETPGPLTPEDG